MELKHLIREPEILKIKADKLKIGDYFKPSGSDSEKDVFEVLSYSLEDKGWNVRNVNTKQPNLLLKTQEVTPLTLIKVYASDKVAYIYYSYTYVREYGS